jgi:5-(carboxyamino)imidazole ribonucleotide synthase
MPTVGIVGAGQLARMMHQAAVALGVDTAVLANAADESAARVASGVELGSPDDLDALRRLARRSDVVTFDHELVEPAHLAALESEGHVLRPGPATLEIAVNKLEQRRRFAAAGLPLPGWAEARTTGEVRDFAASNGWPVVIKAARGGYDGRGVWVCRDETEVATVPRLGDGGRFIVEAFVTIDQELAVNVARSANGETRVYPVVDSLQRAGVCNEVVAPSRQPEAIQRQALHIGFAVSQLVGGAGNLAIELFVSDGRVLINEIAARPHNSGHFSIEGCVTSQFENHLRGVLGWPLGDTRLVAPAAVMVNVFGHTSSPRPELNLPEAVAVEGAHLHWYGKTSRPGRKLGHVTTLGADPDSALATAREAAAILDPGVREAR